MKRLKNYNLYIFENIMGDIEMKKFSSSELQNTFIDLDILESIVTNSDELLNSIGAEEVDLFQTFNFSPDSIKSNFTIEELYDNQIFNQRLIKGGYKKNELESTEETETFMEDTIIVKFFSVYKKDRSELERPEYIIYQSRKRKETKWNPIKCYKVKNDMKNFYDKLTNKTVEIKKGDKTYIYSTSNSGNDWQLQKREEDQDTKTFKDLMSNDDIKAVLLDDDVSITIMA